VSQTIDYFVALASPYTYMGHARLAEIAGRHGATVVTRPVNFGVIFAQTGGLPLPKRAPERRAYRMMELKRWRRRLGVDLNLEPAFFPVDESTAAHVVHAARLAGHDAFDLAGRFLAAVWAEQRNIADQATIAAICGEAGLDGAALLAAREAGAEAWGRETEAALAKGVFGAPTYVLGDELFWGQDRLDFLDQALAA